LPARYALRVRPFCFVVASVLFGISAAHAQEPPSTGDTSLVPPSSQTRAAEELRVEEQQRIMGVLPAFNISNLHDAAPLNTGQKFQLALKSAVDPFSFVAAGLDAGLGQWDKDSPGYGYGAEGYAKRVQAAYLDAFDGAILGNAVLPSILHQDPRYFRQGTGSFGSRLVHAALSTVRCKDDDGRADWNYSNLLGNLAAGAIANSYYAPSERGANLVFGRGLTVTTEGAIGAVFYEFWPDISRKLFKKKPQT
jgi:hypothetical protein